MKRLYIIDAGTREAAYAEAENIVEAIEAWRRRDLEFRRNLAMDEGRDPENQKAGYPNSAQLIDHKPVMR